MTIDFYESDAMIPAGARAFMGWKETKAAIEARVPGIATAQMGLLSTEVITDYGYRVYVHPAEGEAYEIRLDGKCTCTEKELRPAHNLFRMWEAGAFRAGAYDPDRKPWAVS